MPFQLVLHEVDHHVVQFVHIIHSRYIIHEIHENLKFKMHQTIYICCDDNYRNNVLPPNKSINYHTDTGNSSSSKNNLRKTIWWNTVSEV